MDKRSNGLAVAGFVVGIVGLFADQVVVVPLAALVLGIVALSSFDSVIQRGR